MLCSKRQTQAHGRSSTNKPQRTSEFITLYHTPHSARKRTRFFFGKICFLFLLFPLAIGRVGIPIGSSLCSTKKLNFDRNSKMAEAQPKTWCCSGRGGKLRRLRLKSRRWARVGFSAHRHRRQKGPCSTLLRLSRSYLSGCSCFYLLLLRSKTSLGPHPGESR